MMMVMASYFTYFGHSDEAERQFEEAAQVAGEIEAHAQVAQ